MPLPFFRRRSFFPSYLEIPARLIASLLYRVRSSGAENVPARGGVLLIANHISYVDPVVLQLACGRPIRFMAYKGLRRHAFFNWCFDHSGCIDVASQSALEGVRAATEALKRGEVVCLFPEGHISRTGQLLEIKKGFEVIARRAGVPVVPVAIDGLWGSIFSFAGNKYLWKSPRLMPTHVFVAFGKPAPAAEVSPAWARRELLDLGRIAFDERPVLKRHLGRECIRTMAKHPRRLLVVDRTAERRTMTCGQLYAAAAVLSKHLQKTVPERRVGIVLPPGAGAFIANLAVLCAGKIPANLNFTAGRAALEASMRMGGVSTVLSADILKTKIPTFPWPERTLDLRKEIAAAGGKKAMIPWLLASFVLPNQWCASLLGLPRVGDDAEAGLLFTSGSSGEPKGVVLTHRNIFANCAQISSLSILPETCSIIGCLPMFHSFGFTVTLWYPMMRGCCVVTVPSPLETRKIIDAIHEEQATVMLGAPTFVRPILKKAEPHELRSLDLFVTGAEKLPDDLKEGFLKAFHIEILQGYGLTETTPIAALNQPHPPIVTSTSEAQVGKRHGAVGRMMPGMTARIVDPDTGRELPFGETGLVYFMGANVFGGYLNDPAKTEAAFRDGWFVSGDIGRFDDDGFLHIEGRLSRFSKIGGEMVPHGTVEQKIMDAFGWEAFESPVVFVAGVPDASKGEALVLLTVHDVSPESLRARLAEAGVPNLWIPKVVKHVEKIPMLGTGKTDLKRCKELAVELSK